MSQTSTLPVYGKNWSRTKYDQDYVEKDLKQSIAPVIYTLDPIYTERCRPCLIDEPGWIGKQGVSYDSSKPLVDTESDLFNISRIQSRNPSHKYIPPCITSNCIGVMNDCNQCQPNLYNFRLCRPKREYTRLSNSISTLKETGVNRFQPICLDPQDRSRWEHPGEIGINYRMIVKDNHVPCIPTPMDQTSALPPGGDIPCDPIKRACYPPIMALNNYQRKFEQQSINQYKS